MAETEIVHHSGNWAGRFIKFFAHSKITPLLILASILLGSFALYQLPREEEPQIIVPIFDVFVSMPGASPQEVEKRIVTNGERIFWQISGVEYVYSTAAPNGALFIVRFKVGEDMEKSLIKLYTKIYSNLDYLPPGASTPLIKTRSIDDVPILALTFYSLNRSPIELRKIVANLRDSINHLADVSETTIIGGRKRQFQIFFDPAKIAKRLLSPQEIFNLVLQTNIRMPSGHIETEPKLIDVEPNSFILSKEDLENLVVGVSQGQVVYLKDVANIVDGPDQEEKEVSLLPGPAWDEKEKLSGEVPAVTLSLAKRKGSNATFLANKILSTIKELQGKILPEDVHYVITRNYGETAADKSNELLKHMGIAIVGVSILIWFALGFRAALVVIIAIPTTLALTLLTFHLFGFTINRVTLFALIFTIGILVDDPIVGIENIVRHIHLASNRGKLLLNIVIGAMEEIVSPLILATMAVIAAILPMAFVGGLMGPYMRPIPIGASAAMIFSMLVSLSVTPWAAHLLLKNIREAKDKGEDLLTRIYRTIMSPLIYNGFIRFLFLLLLLALLLGSIALIPLKVVRAKMLPFDNKNEFQIILNMPEGTPVEKTREVLEQMAKVALNIKEVKNVEIQAGTHSPYNFNGLVRHYFLRENPYQGDLQVNLVDKHKRKRQSHEIAESIRKEINAIAWKEKAHAQVAEVPPGPPVLSTLVLEVYGPDFKERRALALKLEQLFRDTAGITDIATYEEADRPLEKLDIDIVKSSLNGISSELIAQSITTALHGSSPGLAHLQDEPEPVDIIVRLPKEDRSTDNPFLSISLLSRFMRLIPIDHLVTKVLGYQNLSIYHKNLMPVSYVLADVTNEVGSPVYAIIDFQKKLEKITGPDGKPLEILFTHQPINPLAWGVKWDGEWQVTYEVFRDLGTAFAIVLVLIFILVVGWFQSFKTPWAVMLPIPLSLVGILPAHWLTGMFFTATSMIGMIAGAGIVVRNAIILVDFIELRLAHGDKLEEAVIEAGAVRFRPMLLTASSVIVGSSVILFDPIFQGMALSLMAGEIASTILSRTAVPVFYYLIMKKHKGGEKEKPLSRPAEAKA
ncbi:AcrB/AcrD/AcrF family protein [Candidatus Methylacidiphilum fumarolicum]|uniref:Cation/multidrug efflux pump n=3 Tax=Candidatus Methylacidiphilum fumarolicum TaxID=591154 RepID=I0JXM0_METFB|nr:efflux RND transporter permease subunit [Candidatus Methylacidiphilum fumarolicum]MBW6415874.1 efflux RND transporter permease subunit [Candidatus Methylacidiphilum fumarolicum]TFE70778.1 multidrug transporter AcrB [Candidatus Methylacidiphilum fumarolicum]TFE71437.1 AcrB/AcrD/AcrF family protein [Candidatus Methylacidiphilum fumarolicum]TFE74748.1 AcrB/AcrD/AcrF family protein [Candidatus Methylacidiphilum fumarolicum]TFE76895.1 multidrug transporter AcrB [Candidatus Methylacidiphilum fuma